jgi:hypothetical protein
MKKLQVHNIYSAMISYTATRSDLVGDALIDSVNKYFELAESINASPTKSERVAV